MSIKSFTKDSKKVFVTVGTTSFDELIACITSKEFFKTLESSGVGKLILQIGNGSYQPVIKNDNGIEVDCYRFKPSINEDIEDSDLIITHAGAGSVLETLKAKKPAIVVVNSTLMNNHQTELAEALADSNNLFYCNCKSLPSMFKDMDVAQLVPYHDGIPDLFGEYMDHYMGFS